MFSRIKKYLFNRKFKQGALNRNENAAFIEKVRVVNFIFDAENNKDREICMEFTQKLRFLDCQVNILGYFNQHIKGNLTFPFPIYDKGNLNWIGIPKSDKIDKFCRKKSDLTIIANFHNRPHIDYIALRCDTSLRLGSPSEYDTYSDITIQHDGDQLQMFLTKTLSILNELQLLTSLENKGPVVYLD